MVVKAFGIPYTINVAVNIELMLNLKKLRKIYLSIVLIICLFAVTGLNAYALCFTPTGSSCHKITMMKCSCCQMQVLKKSESGKCGCVKSPLNTNSAIQSAYLQNQSADFKTLCTQASAFSDTIIFENIEKNNVFIKKIYPPNKKLAMLRTVILLNQKLLIKKK